MELRRMRIVLMVGVALVLVALTASGCGESGLDPFQAGQAFREELNNLMREAGQFIAGFCSASILPGLIAAWFLLIRDR